MTLTQSPTQSPIVSLASSVAAQAPLRQKASPVMYTTIVDGVDLRLPLMGLKDTPLERSAVGSGMFGKIHFLWPEETSLSMLTVFYQDLSKEHARRLLAALGPRTIHDKTISFVRDTGVAGLVIPGSVSLRVSAQGNGLWAVTLECPARPNIYATGGIP